MRRLLQLALVGALFSLLPAAGAYAQQTEEYHVKAAFLFHFAQLVNWPAAARDDEKNPLTLCTIGHDPFDGGLETTLQGKSIGTRALQIRHLNLTQEAAGCQVIFIAGRDRKQISSVLAALKDEAILTVGESDDFAKQGGIIGFSMDKSRVRFDINLDAATRVKLKISSRLLLLAKSVIGNRS